MAELIDYALLFGITAIIIYILHKMIQKRQADQPSSQNPPYVDIPNDAQMAQLNQIEGSVSGNGSGITNTAFDPANNNSLRNYCIKSSFNSAYTGGYVNRDMVKFVLMRGCRFLDFEVFMKDNVPIVAYSATDSSFNHFTSEAPAISLGGVFSTIMSNAFNDTSPNPKDPLFIHLRIKSNLPGVYDAVANTIEGSLTPKLYADSNGIAIPVNLDTQLDLLRGKIVVVVDKLSSPGYDTNATCTSSQPECTAISKYINANSGTQTFRIYRENELLYQPINPPEPTVYLMRLVLPNIGFFNNVSNSDSLYLTKNYGAQLVAQAFYENNRNLTIYESLFQQFKSAFVPLSDAVSFAS
jgi:hypothetical protein